MTAANAAAGPMTDEHVRAVAAVLRTSNWALGHVHHVQELATQLFDALRRFHALGDDDLLLLQAAALLHDVGYPTDPRRHHKVSARIVRTQLGPPFTPSQTGLIALLTRYHRKALPKQRHKRFGELSPEQQRLVCWLAGILRVADGLDRSHGGAVRSLVAAKVDERLEIHVHHGARATDHAAALAEDVQGGMRKRDLLERTLGVPVLITAT